MIRYEVANALRFHPGYSWEHVAGALEALDDMQLIVDEMSPLVAESASRISYEEDITFYDAVYLAMAETSGTKVLTADERLFRKVRKRKGLLRLLAKY